MIIIENLSKKFWKKNVLKNVNLVINKNNKYYFTGKNGSGKTTLVKIIMNLEKASSGSIQKDKNISISYLSQDPLILEYLTIKEFLTYSFKKNQVPVEKLKENLKTWNLWNDRNCLLKEASGGMKQKTLLISILNSKSELLILDEPYNMLDLQSKKILNNVLNEINKTLIVITHEEIEPNEFIVVHFNKGLVTNVT